jgi:hypothetical protein
MSWAARGSCYVTDDPAKTPSTFAAPVLPAGMPVRIISEKPRDGLWHSACVAVSLLRFDSLLAATSDTCIASSEAAPCGDRHVLDPPRVFAMTGFSCALYCLRSSTSHEPSSVGKPVFHVGVRAMEKQSCTVISSLKAGGRVRPGSTASDKTTRRHIDIIHRRLYLTVDPGTASA